MRNARSILILSLGANLLLTGWLVVSWQRRPAATPLAAVSPEGPSVLAAAPPASFVRLLRTNLVEFATNTVDAPGFHWSAIETNDFRAYAANLRAVGCPEKTLRHILFPDVEKAYRRRQRDLPKAPEGFWENASQAATRQRALQRATLELEQEKRSLTRELTGVAWSGEAFKLWVEEEEAAFAFGFLPDEKAMPVVGVLESIESTGDGLRHETHGVTSEEDLARIRELAHSVQAQVTALVSPGELQEMQLRLFDALQEDLFDGRRNRGVEMSGVEYRELLRLASQGWEWVTDLLVDALGHDADSFDEIRRRRPERFEAEARALLGDQRFAEYQRSQDKEFQQALEVTDRSQLPESVAIQTYDIRQAALAGARQLAAESGMTAEQQQAALAEMHRATQQALTGLLGAKGGEEVAKRIQNAMAQEARKGRR